MNATADLAPRILSYLKDRHDDMVDLLREMVCLESPSHHYETQTPVQDLICRSLEPLGYRFRRISGNQSGGQLLAVPAGRSHGQPIQMIVGHCDTVWPLGTLDKMPCIVEDGKLKGPGSYDMKAGIVQAIFAIKAAHEIGGEPSVAPVMYINSDEEIGSGDSRANIERLARVANRVFVMEPALGQDGRLKTARKGVGRFKVKVIGKASHAGLAPEKGISAILELSHVVQSLFKLNDPKKGITVNVGTIDGGLRPNVVAPEANAVADVRVVTQGDANEIEKAIYSLQPEIPGTKLEISGRVGRPPMEKTLGNERLWELAQDSAKELNLSIEDGRAGGGSDGNFTSLFAPTLDGMGAVGDGAHAITEFVYLDKMPERAALLARMFLLPKLELED